MGGQFRFPLLVSRLRFFRPQQPRCLTRPAPPVSTIVSISLSVVASTAYVTFHTVRPTLPPVSVISRWWTMGMSVVTCPTKVQNSVLRTRPPRDEAKQKRATPSNTDYPCLIISLVSRHVLEGSRAFLLICCMNVH